MNNETKSANEFIRGKKLKHIAKNMDFMEDHLPIESGLGTVYLIKNNTIIEFYSYCDHAFSTSLFMNKHRPMWICKPEIISIDKQGDDSLYLIDGIEYIYKISDSIYTICEFLHNGFELYIFDYKK